MLDLAGEEPGLTQDQRRRRSERRSAWLRLLVLMILAVNLAAATERADALVHAKLVAGYGVATLLSLALAASSRSPTWSAVAFVIIDAALVVAMFHAHLFAPTGTGLDHRLTAPALAVGFVLLTHVALRLRPRLVALFSALVIGGWMALLGIAVGSHAGAGHDWRDIGGEGALAAAFAFAALVCCLLTRDHNVLLNGAVTSERKRRSLARFFSPKVVDELEATATSLALARREAAVMFVDLRSFTRFSETASPEEVAELLAEYRELVAREVFRNGGVIDKFIGDGVMAGFGHPRPSGDDAAQALRCALELRLALKAWKESRVSSHRQGLDAGIGLHFGTVISGVLESGLHHEFALLGDAVNIAERLERLCRPLEATLVVSATLAAKAGAVATIVPWQWERGVQLKGREGRLAIAYLGHESGKGAFLQRVDRARRRP